MPKTEIEMISRDFSHSEWQEILSDLGQISLLQTWEYGAAKCQTGSWQCVRSIFCVNGAIVGAAQAIIRTIPGLGRGLIWLNQGPLIKRQNSVEDIENLIKIINLLYNHWVVEKKMYFMLAPYVKTTDPLSDILTRLQLPVAKNKPGWVSEIIDLSKSVEDLRRGLRQKWRNHLNKSERLDLTCEVGTSTSFMAGLLEDYQELISRKQLKSVVAPKFLSRLQEVLPEERKMMVFVASQNKIRLGSVLIVPFGKTCLYFVGAVNDQGRKTNANYFLLWQAVCQMKALGYKYFDIGGADPQKTETGVLHFKTGLGGEQYQLIGEFHFYNNQNLMSRGVNWAIAKYLG